MHLSGDVSQVYVDGEAWPLSELRLRRDINIQVPIT